MIEHIRFRSSRETRLTAIHVIATLGSQAARYRLAVLLTAGAGRRSPSQSHYFSSHGGGFNFQKIQGLHAPVERHQHVKGKAKWPAMVAWQDMYRTVRPLELHSHLEVVESMAFRSGQLSTPVSCMQCSLHRQHEHKLNL